MKRSMIILLSLIFICSALLFALRPSPSITFKEELVQGQTTTQVVLEDWTFTSAKPGKDSVITLSDGKSTNAKWMLTETVPPTYSLSQLPNSFYYHHIYVAPIHPEMAKVIMDINPTVTYFLNCEAKQIRFKQ